MSAEDPSKSWTTRPATLEDAATITNLFNATSQHFTGTNRTTGEEIRAWMSAPHFDLNRDTRMVLGESGTLFGLAYLRDPGEPYVSLSAGIVVGIGPIADARLWATLLAWVESRARTYIAQAPATARVSLKFSGFSNELQRWQAVERLGAKQIRVLNRMRIDLHNNLVSPTWPDGIAIRTYRHSEDLRPLVTAVLEAFADHWGFVETSLEDEVARWRARIDANRALFDFERWFLAVEGSEIVGFALCSPDIAGDTSRSELDPLGVRSAWRGQGIGLALLQHAFREARSKGIEAIELEMDSENLTGAARLYERAGMRVIRQQTIYEKELRPGIDWVKRA